MSKQDSGSDTGKDEEEGEAENQILEQTGGVMEHGQLGIAVDENRDFIN